MSYPVGQPPSSAYVEGTVRDAQGQSEQSIRNGIRQQGLEGFDRGQDNLWGSGGFLGFLVRGIFGIIGGVADFIGGILGIKNKAVSASEQVAAQAGSIEGLEVRVTALEGGGTRTVYSSNFVWENPGAGTVGVAVFNGGQCGQIGYFNNSDNPTRGGTHGGYAYKEIRCADLPATVTGTVGAGGATNLQAGGQSSFGTYVVPISGASGSVLTKQGAVSSNSTPGRGGNGGDPQSGSGSAGEPSALAAGGTAGVGGPGGAGASVPLESDVPCGGGGGGGGAGRGGAFQSPFPGGAGGAPGGGGGAGGRAGGLNSAATASPGPGANGRIILIYTPGATV